MTETEKREEILATLQRNPDPEHLWECIIAFQDYHFETISGLPFTYQLKRGRNGELTKELWIDRRKNSKSLAWSSVLKAFEKIVTNQDSMPYINNLVDGVTVTVPNNDLSDQYPEFYEGNQVTLDDSNIRDFLQHRDTDTEFSNEGRIERQKVYMSAYVDKIKSLDESKLEDTWNSLDSMKDYLQTNITRNQYLKFIKLIRKVDFSDEDIIQLSGSDKEGEIHDEFYPDETELKKLIIQLFYEKV